MAKMQLIAGLELGRAAFRMSVCEAGEGERLNPLAVSEIACLDGVKNSTIVNLDSAVEAVIKLREDVHQKTAQDISSVYVNISGPNIKQETVHSVITLPQRGCEITEKNINDLIESCKIVSVPMDRFLLYLLPLEYVIDGQDGIVEPVGLCASRLEARILIILAPYNQVQNIIKVVNSAGLEVKEVILTALANSCSVLTAEEKGQGVLLIDFKTDFTELVVFKEGRLIHFEAIPSGQGDVTNEIGQRLNIPFIAAEGLKIKYGFIDPLQTDPRNLETIPLEWMAQRQDILRQELNRIITEKENRIFDLILERLKVLENFKNVITKGAVMTGGATSLEGFLEAAAQKFGFTTSIGGKHTISSGLVRFAFEKGRKAMGGSAGMGFFKRLYQKADELLTEYF